jgi:hypothetical protein
MINNERNPHVFRTQRVVSEIIIHEIKQQNRFSSDELSIILEHRREGCIVQLSRKSVRERRRERRMRGKGEGGGKEDERMNDD